MRIDFYENIYIELKKEKENKEGSWRWLNRRPWYFWLCFVIFIIAAVIFVILGSIISFNNFNCKPVTFKLCGCSIMAFIICCFIMDIINTKRRIRDNFADYSSYLDYCERLHNGGADAAKGFRVYIKDVKHYECMLKEIKIMREALISKFSRSFKKLGTLIISVYVAFVLSCVPRLLDFYFSESFNKEKLFKVIALIILFAFPFVVEFAYTWLDYNSQKRKIKTYEEMERDIETIIEISNNLYPPHKIQFGQEENDANTTNT